MISRHWIGIAKPGRAEEYIAHLRAETFPAIATIPGFLRASILRRDVAEGTEFQIVTTWDSMSAIQAFAGSQAESAVVPPVVRSLMIRFDEHVRRYEVAHELHTRDLGDDR